MKRLESSFHAFQETLARFIRSHEVVLQAFDDGFVYTSRKHSNKVLEFLADGRVGKASIRKVKEAFDATDDPVIMIAILRRDIARQYLLGPTHKPDKDAPLAPREVILSSYLP